MWERKHSCILCTFKTSPQIISRENEFSVIQKKTSNLFNPVNEIKLGLLCSTVNLDWTDKMLCILILIKRSSVNTVILIPKY